MDTEIITVIMIWFIIPGFIAYKLFGKKVAIGYVLLSYAFISWFGQIAYSTTSSQEQKEALKKYQIKAVLGGIVIFYVLNKYLK